ncbi:MAG: DUF4390 domain-containing protein, partial [Thermodesulfobacteriota bacterium]|nr:DUF4390 domain-containing protein [Thermodesulfobacteriota bacterium]
FMLTLALIFAQAGTALAQGLDLDNFVLDNQAGRITVRFGVRVFAFDELEEVLSDGSSVGLVCEASVYRKRALWPDSEVAATKLVSLLRKHGLAQDFEVTLSDEKEPLSARELPALLEKAWGEITLDLGLWEALEPGSKYSLQLEISLMRMDVPVWLRYMVFFWSWDVLPSTGYRLDFEY